MDGLEISEREVRGVTILDLSGRLVLEDGVDLFTARMNQLRQSGRKWISARNRNGDVKLLHLRPKSHTVLKTTKLLTVLESFESEDEAIESFLIEHDDDTHPIFT